MANWSPSMNTLYSEKDLDEAADLYESGVRSSKVLHEALVRVEREANQKHVAYHKARIDREQDEMAVQLMREFNMLDN